MFESLLWGIPFISIIVSMSLFPIIFPKFWHRFSEYVPIFFSLTYVIPAAYIFGVMPTCHSVIDTLLSDYVSFIIQIATLYIISGGIYINIAKQSSPLINSVFLFVSSLLAGWIGTTGAATLLIRPFLRMNSYRKYRTHMLVFFIIAVANIGGAASPLGDPPLFVGFINGIDFFWFSQHLYPYIIPTLLIICALFFCFDSWLIKRENILQSHVTNDKLISIRGRRNIYLLGSVLLIFMLCNFRATVDIFGKDVKIATLIRNILLITISILSLKITSPSTRERNNFSFEPLIEVAWLFIGIFITAIPIIEMLHQGNNGPLQFVFDALMKDGEIIKSRCFWISGLLSCILDNTPTFLIMFHMASGDAVKLMTDQAPLLIAFSISTVFMGALTYIGNAPNLMVTVIAQRQGVKVPSFLGYMGWSFTILIPIFIVISIFL